MTDIEKIKDLIKRGLTVADNATPGPWHYDCGNGEVESEDDAHYRITVAERPDLWEREQHCGDFSLGYDPPHFPRHPDEDMLFIAESRTLVPSFGVALLAAVEALNEILFSDPSWEQRNETCRFALNIIEKQLGEGED